MALPSWMNLATPLSTSTLYLPCHVLIGRPEVENRVICLLSPIRSDFQWLYSCCCLEVQPVSKRNTINDNSLKRIFIAPHIEAASSFISQDQGSVVGPSVGGDIGIRHSYKSGNAVFSVSSELRYGGPWRLDLYIVIFRGSQ